MYRVELGKSLHRLRTWLLAALACAVAILPVVVLSASPDASGAPQFLDLIRHNGLFDPLAAIVLVQPFFLPLATGLLAGDAIAGDATGGTLRYLLIRPVSRGRLVLTKLGAVVTMLGAGIGLLLIVGLASGAIVFGVGPLPTLSGTIIGIGPGLLRIFGAAGYVVLAMAALAAVGLLLSSLTDSGPGATVGTVVVALTSQILDTLSSLRSSS